MLFSRLPTQLTNAILNFNNISDQFAYFRAIMGYVFNDDSEKMRYLQLKKDIQSLCGQKPADQIQTQLSYKKLYDYKRYMNSSVPEHHKTSANFSAFPFEFLTELGVIDPKVYQENFMQHEILMIRLTIELHYAQLMKKGKYQQFIYSMIVAFLLSMTKVNKITLTKLLIRIYRNVSQEIQIFTENRETWDLYYSWNGYRIEYILHHDPSEKVAASQYCNGDEYESREVYSFGGPRTEFYHTGSHGNALKYFYPYRIRSEEFLRLLGGICMQLQSIIYDIHPALENQAELREENSSILNDLPYLDYYKYYATKYLKQNWENLNPLQLAVLTGNTVLATQLVESKIDPQCKDKFKNTLLHLAAYSHNPLMIDWCYKLQIFDLKAKNKFRHTPLECAKKAKNNFAVEARLQFFLDKEHQSRLVAYPKSYNKLLFKKDEKDAAVLLSDYASKGFKFFHWNRHHRQLAGAIAGRVKNIKEIKDICKILESEKLTLIQEGKLNVKGSFARRVGFILKLQNGLPNAESKDSDKEQTLKLR